jgi:hypothetical protein
MWNSIVLKNGDYVRDTTDGWLCVIIDCSIVNRVLIRQLYPPYLHGDWSLFKGCCKRIPVRWLRAVTEKEKQQLMLKDY